MSAAATKRKLRGQLMQVFRAGQRVVRADVRSRGAVGYTCNAIDEVALTGEGFSALSDLSNLHSMFEPTPAELEATIRERLRDVLRAEYRGLAPDYVDFLIKDALRYRDENSYFWGQWGYGWFGVPGWSVADNERLTLYALMHSIIEAGDWEAFR